MRMNKKLKNVLAFGLATSFVLTSTMGALATDDVNTDAYVSEDTADEQGITAYATKYATVTVIFWDTVNGQMAKQGYMNCEFPTDSIDVDVNKFNLPSGYELDGSQETVHIDYDGYKTTATVNVKPAAVEEDVQRTLEVYFNDVDNNWAQVGDKQNLPHTFKAGSGETEYTFGQDELQIPATWEFVGLGDGQSLTVKKDQEYNTVNVLVRKEKEPEKEAVTTDVIVNFYDVDAKDAVKGEDGKEITWNTTFTFKPGQEEGWADISGVEIPEGYEPVTTPDVATVYVNDALKNYVTVDVKKTKEPVEEAVTTDVIVNFYDVDAKDAVKGEDGKEITWNTTFTFKPGQEEGWADISGVEIPEGYEPVTTPDVATVYVNDALKNYVTVDVKKTKEPVEEAVTTDVIVNFYDVDAKDAVKGEDGKEITWNTTFTFKPGQEEGWADISGVEIPEGYEPVTTPDVATVYVNDALKNYVTVDVKKVKEPEEEKRTVNVTFTVDPEKGEFTDPKGAEVVTFNNLDEYSDGQYNIPSVKGINGYKFVGWKGQGAEEINWSADAKTFGVTGLAFFAEGSKVGYASIEAVFEKEEEPAPETRTANVYFNVDPEKGSFPAYAPSTVVSFENLDEFSDQQFEIPAVEAKEGYKFVGWKGQGADVIEWDADATTFGVTGLAFFAEGSNVGYASVEAVFEKEEEPAPEARTANVYFSVDPEKGSFPAYAPSTVVSFENLDEFSDQQFEIPAVEAKEGYKFVGWKGQGADVIEWDADATTFGVTGLAFFAEGSNVGYASVEAVFEKEEEPAPEARTANVYFSVDPEKGSFPAYAPSTVVSFENLDEFSDQQLEIPAVEAKEGYKFVGWKGQGADVIEWDADAKTFGVTGLAFFEEGSNVGNASVEAVFEEVEPETTTPTEPDTTAPTEPDTTAPTEPDTTAPTEPDTTAPTEPDTTEPTTEPTTDSEEETTEKETDKKTVVTEKNNKSDDNSNKTSDSAVKTGDTTTVMPYVIALFAAAALIVVLALKKRRTF